MKHKCKCPVCGEMKYLHGVEVGGSDKIAPFIAWLCDDCDHTKEDEE